MTTKTVTWVGDDLSPYEANGKTTYYVNVAFDDDSTGSLGKQNQGKAGELREMLVALKGTPAEFGLEEKQKPNKKGQPSYKIKSFPGYEPAPFEGGGGGKSKSPAELDSIARSVALKAAVDFCIAYTISLDDGQFEPVADRFYAWLSQSSPASGHTESTTTTAPLPQGNTAAGSSPGTSSSGEVADTTSVGERVTPASSDAPRGREGSGQVEVAPDPSHIHDLHPLRAGSKIMRCSVAGCPHTERRDVA